MRWKCGIKQILMFDLSSYDPQVIIFKGCVKIYLVAFKKIQDDRQDLYVIAIINLTFKLLYFLRFVVSML